MKRQVITLLLAIMALAATQAQQISVVTSGGSTSLHRTLKDAIESAENGSVIYLPGGGFSIADSVKINNKITIIGIGHKTSNENVDGITIISGNLWFNQGSSNSAVMGCYISGNVIIGEDGAVNDMLIKYCNLNSVQIKNSQCFGTVINQNYVRGDSDFGLSSNVTISNNVISRICNVESGTIKYNVVCYDNYYNYGYGPGNPRYSLEGVHRSTITNNIFRYGTGRGKILNGIDCQTSNNFLENGSFGDNPIEINASITDILVNVNNWNISPLSNFHFSDTYNQYENQVGIYGGTSFSDSQLPPTPYIVGKVIPDHTDAEGKLNIKVRVKASE